jgi:hypothetical protein
VTHVYVDADAAEISGSGDRSVDADAVRALSFLTGDHDIVLVAAPDQEPPADLRTLASQTVSEVPGHPSELSWYLTADVDRCTGTSARLRTVLIGAAPPSGSVHRCDSVARDIQAAVMEILASEAMPSR